MSDDWKDIFGETISAEEDAARIATARERGIADLARFGLTHGQRVAWAGGSHPSGVYTVGLVVRDDVITVHAGDGVWDAPAEELKPLSD